MKISLKNTILGRYLAFRRTVDGPRWIANLCFDVGMVVVIAVAVGLAIGSVF